MGEKQNLVFGPIKMERPKSIPRWKCHIVNVEKF